MLTDTVVAVLLVVNVSAILATLYLFRFSLACGLGIGVYSLWLYLPSALLALGACPFAKARCLKVFRNIVVGLNVVYLGVLLVQGTCFSCVDECVQEAQAADR